MEALKADGKTTTEVIYKLLNKIWKDEALPTEWNTGSIITLPKKDDRPECKN